MGSVHLAAADGRVRREGGEAGERGTAWPRVRSPRMRSASRVSDAAGEDTSPWDRAAGAATGSGRGAWGSFRSMCDGYKADLGRTDGLG